MGGGSNSNLQHRNSFSKMLHKHDSGSDFGFERSFLSPKMMTVFCALIASLGYVSSGTLVGWSSNAISLFVPADDATEMFSKKQLIWITASLAVGALLAPLLVHRIYRYIGTKYLVLMSCLFTTASWALVAFFTENLGLLISGRILGGMSIGISYTLIPLYLNELAASENRYITDTILYVNFGVGVLIQYVTGYIPSLMLIACLPIALPILLFIGFFFMPESPRYLCQTGREKLAKLILEKFRLTNEEIDTDIQKWMQQMEDPSTLKSAFRGSSNLILMLPVFGLHLFEKLIGVTVVFFYLNRILTLTGGAFSPQMTAIILVSIFIASLPVYKMINIKIKDRTTLLVSCIIMLLSMLVLGAFCHIQGVAAEPSENYEYIELSCLGIFIFLYAIGIHRLSGKYVFALTPSTNHFKITVMTTSAGWLINLGLLRLLPMLIDHIGVGWVFWNIAIVLIFTIIFIRLFVPDLQEVSVVETQLVESSNASKCTSSDNLDIV